MSLRWALRWKFDTLCDLHLGADILWLHQPRMRWVQAVIIWYRFLAMDNCLCRVQGMRGIDQFQVAIVLDHRLLLVDSVLVPRRFWPLN